MRSIKIGTRNSPLAIWQAEEVAQKLQDFGASTEIVPIVSSGDKNLSQPLYSLGITGVFTKDLDVALLNNQIDIAVHSLKDIPTILPKNICISAQLERDFPEDVLVRNSQALGKNFAELKIATSSLRRRAFWLENFPETEFCDIRGNVNTRLKKLEDGLADATLFSLAGLKRLNLQNIDYEKVPFMISAPSQGVVAICARENDAEILEVLSKINHRDTEICTTAERTFLNTLEGGCTAPIGALAEIIDGKLRMKVRLSSLDGRNVISMEEIFGTENPEISGRILAEKILANGGKEIMAEIKSALNKE